MAQSYQWNGSNVLKAVAYYRHSAEDKQENSVPIQKELTHEFARKNGIQIIHEEADEGKTGLLADRPGFNRLFQDWILNNNAPTFTYVLVYDVSRWGRFQKQDEAGYHQHLCTQHGKEVIYVTHGFIKQENPAAIFLQTSVERYMAAEYSRQLSDKVFHGSAKISQEGFSAGGMACYGMGRLLLDEQKRPVRILRRGEHKQISNERVTFVPLNNQETQTVKEIFHCFVERNMSPVDIAGHLNRLGVVSASGGSWNRNKVIHILSNETYAGSRIYNKTWNRLRQGKRKNPRTEWVIRPNAFPAVIDSETFLNAQEKLYWYTLKLWKMGQKVLQKAREIVRQRIFEILIENKYEEIASAMIVDQFPLVFSIGLASKNGATQWCFILPDEMQNEENVLCIGVNTKLSEPIDYVFLIPTADFVNGSLRTLTTNDPIFSHYLVKSEQLNSTIIDFLKILITEKLDQS